MKTVYPPDYNPNPTPEDFNKWMAYIRALLENKIYLN